MAQGPRSRALVALLCLAASLGCRERNRGTDRPTEVAQVNGVGISVDQFAQELAFARRTSAGVLPQTDAENLAFRRATLEDMIDRILVLNAAHEAGISVSAEKVDREMLRLQADYHGAGFNEALAEGQISQQELRERSRARLVAERYFVDEVFARVVVTDTEVEAWYRAHEADFAQPEQVRAAQIVVKTPQDAQRILQKIREGMSFDEAARRFSLSPDAKVGGDLGFFKKGVMPPAFEQTCFALQNGKVSEVVGSEYGYHLFKLLDRKGAEQRPLAKVRGEVEKLLLQKKREDAQKKALAELRAGPDAAGCKSARGDGGIVSEDAIAACLKKAGEARIQIDEAVLAKVQP